MGEPFPGLGERPKLHQLMLLKCPNGREIRIIQDIAFKRNELGPALRFEGPVLATIEQGAHYQPEPACQEILRRWLEGSGRQPVTWKTLIEALNEVYPVLATDLRDAFKISPSDNKTGAGDQSTPDSETLLNVDDHLGELTTLLNHLAGYWKKIAVQLRMTSQVVNVSRNRENVVPSDFLVDFLTRWLNRQNPSPTLKALCRALRADAEIIGGGNAASKLEEKFKNR